MYKVYPEKRYNETLKLLQQFAPSQAKILDVGVENPFTHVMREHGYWVENTKGEDLDFHPEVLQDFDVEFVTALEILEHLVNPLGVLTNLPADKLLVSVPLKLWFSPAYRNKHDDRDVHYHEFEDWQFDFLLEKAGWEIKHRHKWTHPAKKLGFRPILRYFYPRYYAIYAERKK
ncbi:methyltransferase [Vaginella massiliensis]|uniref:methyltransferase n=1 Tax=Vaginella massiliensis TaxID=1816680 RepID=UPI000837C904|nr:methyltransferase [Vaginella massiliensis]